jgi:N-acetylmuramoyl-L-alanine amidase
MLIKPQFIFIHHSLTRDSGTVSWNAIRSYHVDHLHWRDIGYHYGIEEINGRAEILVGRFEGETGAHTKGYNRDSIGICLVGNYDVEDVTIEKWGLTLQLVKNICLRYEIPVKNVLAHREVTPHKSCPGNLFDMGEFRDDLNDRL